MIEVKETTEKVSADNSFLLSLVTPKEGFNFTMPLVSFASEENVNEANLIFDYDFSIMKDKLKEYKEFAIVADYTDDPTPDRAGSVVSLGYPLVRITFKKAKLISLKPLVFNGKADDFDVMFNREQRDSLIEMPKHKTFNPNLEISKKSNMRKYFVFSPGFSKPLYVIVCVLDEKKFTSIEMLDMTSFYHRPEIVYFKEHKTNETAINDYKKLIKKWKVI